METEKTKYAVKKKPQFAGDSLFIIIFILDLCVSR